MGTARRLSQKRVRFKVLQQVKQLLMYRTPVSSPKALDQSTAGTAARWATRSAKLGGVIAFAPPASERQFHVVGC